MKKKRTDVILDKAPKCCNPSARKTMLESEMLNESVEHNSVSFLDQKQTYDSHKRQTSSASSGNFFNWQAFIESNTYPNIPVDLNV